MRAGKPAIVSDPMPPHSVIDHADAIGADLWLVGRDFNHRGDRQQWSWSGRGRRYNALAYPALRGANQLLNASGALAALEALRERLPITAQAVRNGLAMVELPGRFQIVPGQPTLVLDVAHNPQAVAALAREPRRDGLLSRAPMRCSARCATRTSPALLARMAPLVDALALLRPADAARGHGRRAGAHAARGRWPARGAPVPMHAHASPADGAARGPGRGRPR